MPDTAKRYAGNNLSCSNCHLDAGKKKFGLPIFGLFELFPQYSARLGAEITIEDRVNSCMTRSMNGRDLPNDSPEMQAIVAYIKFLSTGVPSGTVLPGLGAGNMPELKRAADPARGKAVYSTVCLSCHNADGSGIRRSLPTTDLGYMVPPLWGPDSSTTAPDGEADHRRQLPALQHAAWRGLSESAAFRRAGLGCRGLHDLAAAADRRRDWTRIFPICCKSRSTFPMGLMPTASVRSSTNTVRLPRSVRRSRS